MVPIKTGVLIDRIYQNMPEYKPANRLAGPVPGAGRRLLQLVMLILLLPAVSQGFPPDEEGKLPFKVDREKKNRIGFKTVKPFLQLKKIGRERLDYDLETGSVVETIILPGTGGAGDMVLQIHHYSVLDYLDQHVREMEEEAFSEVSSKYLTGEVAAGRQGGTRQGIMPEINLPDFMPKSLASIIGEGTGSLSIHGRSVTELSGTTSFQKPEDQSLFRRQSKFPRLKLDQRQQINIEGVIGTKIHVFVDYNSQNEFANRNKIEVKYVGEEDEILQSLELGDVNLSLPPSMLVSANIPRGNFGIKGQTRLGALTTTFIASKEEGESSNKNIKIPVTGTAEASDSTVLADVNFSTNRHFLLVDTSRIANRHIKFLERRGVVLKNPGEMPQRVRVFKDNANRTDDNTGDNQARPGYMFMDPNHPDPTSNEDLEFGFFNEMVIGRDYVLEECGAVISFVGYVGPQERIGVIYQQLDGNWVGSAGTRPSDTLQLKLIKPDLLNTEHAAWPLMLRNVYSFGGYGAINQTNFSIDIFTNQTPPRYDEYDSKEGKTRTFLEIFGLDNDGDTKVDPAYIDFTRGLVFFPSLEPFRQPYNNENESFALLTKNRLMYTEDAIERLNTREYQKYNIILRYNRAEGSSARTFDLGAMQIVENSERIYINERLLRRGVDYTIDYQFGQLTLKPTVEIPPNSEVKVDFEEVPLFATGNTSLFGFHNEYEFDPQRRNYLTSTMFFQSIESVDRTFVRLGDEPKTSMLGELGGKFEFDSERLTGWLNELPLFQSRTPSRINLTGGLAFSNPNPNTQGGVLIEDFETSKIENPLLRLTHQTWRASSLPEGESGMSYDGWTWEEAATAFWFDPYYLSATRYGFYEQDVFGQIEGRFERHRQLPVSAISVVFEPQRRANGRMIDKVNETEMRRSWRSIVQAVSETGIVGMDEREFLQIFIATGRDQGKLIIDFGQVNEDQVRFNEAGEPVGISRMDTEDKNFDGRLDHNEDTGLDGEPGADRDWVEGSPDDGNDDYYRPSEQDIVDGRWINLTEGNNKGMIGASFDTEDLNTNGVLDLTERVFRVILDLKTLELEGSNIPVEDRNVMIDHIPYDPLVNEVRQNWEHLIGTDDWYMLQIPLPKEGSRAEQWYRKIGGPSLSNILHVRFTLYDFTKADTVNFAAVAFVGNRFKTEQAGVSQRLEETIILDTLSTEIKVLEPDEQEVSQAGLLAAGGFRGVVDVNTVNTILNNEYYPPPMVSATLNKFNRSGRQEDFTAQESALRLEYRDLQRGYEGSALKAENNQQSYLDYASMSFHVNGRQGPYDPKPTFFIRIGTDRENYYEYSMAVDTGWTEVTVPFDALLKLKEDQQSMLDLRQIQNFDKDVKRGPYRIKGNPSLTKVTIMSVGIANESSDVPVSGEIWIDDVRLTDVIKEFGINSRMQVDAQLSDLGRVNFSVAARDNKFRNLNESIPRNSSFDYNVGGSLNVDRLVPDKWGLRLPVNFRKTFRRNSPRFHPGSEDVTIQSAENKERYKTETTSHNFSISYSKSKGTRTLSRYLFDRLNGSLSYNSSRTIAPKSLSNNTSISGRLTYRATLPRDAEQAIFPPRIFGFLDKVPLPYFFKTSGLVQGVAQTKLRYMPNDFELDTSGNYNRRVSYNPISDLISPDTSFMTTSGVRVRYSPVVSAQTSYDLQVDRNMLAKQEGGKLLGFDIGKEVGRKQGVQLQLAPKSIPWLQPNYRYQGDYNNDFLTPRYNGVESVDRNFRKFDSRRQETVNLRFMLPQFRKSLAGMRLTDPAAARKKQQQAAPGKSSSAAYTRTPKKPGGTGGKSIFSRFIFRPINYFLDSFDPLSVQLSRNRQERWDKMERNPGLLYQIGLAELDADTRIRPTMSDSTRVDTANFAAMNWSFTRAYSSGFRLYKARISGNYMENGGNSHNINGYTFNRQNGPEYNFDYSDVYVPGFLRGALARVDFASGYELKKSFRGNSNKMVVLQEGDEPIAWERQLGVETITREENWRPKYRVSADWGRTGTIRTRYTKNESYKRDFLLETNKFSITENSDDNFNLQYSFSAPHGISLPFLKGIKLQSNVRTSIDLSRRINRTYTQVLDELGKVALDDKGLPQEIINRDTEDISITPTLSYDFAQVIGSLSASYNSMKDRKNGTTRVTISMKVTVQLDF
ncbi:MAG: cell surface protein SprA [Candidatus Glassbacteria bacterium]|nr:cell surface protein SprA [Candidatus Glassbacteria bacterium]